LIKNTGKNTEKIIKNFSKIKVLVVGDVMLDRYWWGNVSRISPEAPVPVVSLEKTSLAAGGAANVAANVAGLGAEPFLIGITGEDEEAKIFPKVLQKANISNYELFPIKNRQTTTKTRIIAHNQQVARIDRETTTYLSFGEVEKFFGKIKTAIKKTDAIVISDYAKGFLTGDLLMRLITTGNENNKMILIDPKGKDYSKYKGATILTPNQRETAEALGLDYDNQSLAEEAGKHILEKLMLQAMLITQGEHGMTLLQKGGEKYHLKAAARKVYDVTGAGDTVIAATAVALASGLSFLEAAEIANKAAGLVVEEVGTTAITPEMLRKLNQ
jgi:rfaE bifunctional protein kinase chain/domain